MFERPIAPQLPAARGIVGGGHVGAGQVCQPGDEFRAVLPFGCSASVEQQVAIGHKGVPPGRQTVGVLVEHRRVQASASQPQAAGRPVGHDVDGAESCVALQDLADLIDPVGVGLQDDEVGVLVCPGARSGRRPEERLVVLNSRVDEDYGEWGDGGSGAIGFVLLGFCLAQDARQQDSRLQGLEVEPAHARCMTKRERQEGAHPVKAVGQRRHGAFPENEKARRCILPTPDTTVNHRETTRGPPALSGKPSWFLRRHFFACMAALTSFRAHAHNPWSSHRTGPALVRQHGEAPATTHVTCTQ